MLSINRSFIFLLIPIFLVACNKEETPSDPKDYILHHEFDPAVEMSTILSVNSGVVTPIDSTTTYALDLNHDNIIDFNIVMMHSNQNGAAYSQLITISGSSNESEVSTISGFGLSRAHLYSEGSEISSDEEMWESTTRMFSIGNITDGYFASSGTHYIGLRTRTFLGWNYSWLKFNISPVFKLTLLSYGHNKTPGNSILAGQEE